MRSLNRLKWYAVIATLIIIMCYCTAAAAAAAAVVLHAEIKVIAQ